MKQAGGASSSRWPVPGAKLPSLVPAVALLAVLAIPAAVILVGLIVYPMAGTIDGERGDHVLLAPPFIVNEEQIAEIVERLGLAIDDAIGAA